VSVADLKSRLADVPGIQTLTMAIEAGRIMLRWGDHSAAVDVTASDAEIEAAIRNASKLPPVSLIPDKPAPVLAQPSGKPMSVNPADTMNALDAVMTDHVRMMGDIHAAQLEILKATLARQRDSIAKGVGSMAQQIDSQTDAFEAMMSRYTNGAPK
jgi:hypothetical protein